MAFFKIRTTNYEEHPFFAGARAAERQKVEVHIGKHITFTIDRRRGRGGTSDKIFSRKRR